MFRTKSARNIYAPNSPISKWQKFLARNSKKVRIQLANIQIYTEKIQEKNVTWLPKKRKAVNLKNKVYGSVYWHPLPELNR